MSKILLLTNDDGIEAPGLAALERAVAGLGRPWVIAPDGPYSGCGHVVTTHEPIAFTKHSDTRFGIKGSPADCSRLAINHLAAGLEWILAGINAGGNLGVDVYHSGTVAAVREGAIHGKPGVAVSHYIARGKVIDWEVAASRTNRVLADLLSRGCPLGTFWNVNLPHLEPDSPEPEVVFCEVDPSPLPVRYEVDPEIGLAHYRGIYQERLRREGMDVDVCFSGSIAVSLIRV